MSKKLNRETAKQEWDDFTYETLPILKLTALSELKGGNYLMKLKLILDKKGEIVDKKYVPVDWESIEEVLLGINWILENKDKESEVGDPFFYVSQRAPKHNFFESLLSRGIGKPTDEIKIEHNVHTFAEAVKRAKDKKTVTEDQVASSINAWL